MKVQVGTDTQQNDGTQHVVDQVAKLGLQISLSIPENLKERDGWDCIYFIRNCIKNIYFSLGPLKELTLMLFRLHSKFLLTRTNTDPQTSMIQTAKKIFNGLGGSEGKMIELMMVTWKRWGKLIIYNMINRHIEIFISFKNLPERVKTRVHRSLNWLFYPESDPTKIY